MMPTYDYKKGLTAMLGCFLIWGFQPLYWYLCGDMDTFFMMANRIVWAAVCCVMILWVQGKLPQLWAAFRDKQVMKREVPAAVFLFGDWIVYLWAVKNGRVLECSLGYYIQPLVVFAFGAVVFHEKISWRHFVAIDKLDKIGLDNVNAELKEKGISDEAIAKLQPIILLSGSNEEKLATLKEVLAASETGLKGVEESEFILSTLKNLGLKNEIELDLTLARGLNYYTGAIFEVKALDVQIGSITGGGRYDNLTGVFGMSGVSGVGISFGADRIFDVLNQLDLYPKEAVNGTQLLFINFGEKEAAFSMNVLAGVRAAGIRAEIFPDASKMKKQMGYANSKAIPFVALVGENEMNEGKVTLKNMETGEQKMVTPQELVSELK